MEVEIFKPYPYDILPQGFKYPFNYLALLNNTSSLSLLPNFHWWFINAESEAGKLAYELRKKRSKFDSLCSFI